MDLLKYINARLGESSTWASIAGLLLLAHVSVPAGAWQSVTMVGIIASGGLGVLLTEAGNKPSAQVAEDVIKAVAAGIAATQPKTPAA